MRLTTSLYTKHFKSSVASSGTVGTDDNVIMNVLIPYVPLVDHGVPLSQFERLLLGRMDVMANDKKEHYNFVLPGFNT